MRSRSTTLFCLLLLAAFGVASTGFAYDHKQIEARVAAGLEEFDTVVTNSEEIIDAAAGILVCPKVSKVGLGVGLEKGNCALMVRIRNLPPVIMASSPLDRLSLS